MKKRLNFKKLSIAALMGIAMFGFGANSVQATDTTALGVPLLPQAEYGDKNNYDTAKYYKWEYDISIGSYALKEGTESDKDITYYVNNTRPTMTEYLEPEDGDVITGNFFDYTDEAIDNWAEIGDITASFINNESTTIYNNSGDIANITADFIYNNEYFDTDLVQGAAITNFKGTIGDIKGDFIGNRIETTLDVALGGAIENYEGVIGKIQGDFIGNIAVAATVEGGAIHNDCNCDIPPQIGGIEGNFIGNIAYSVLYSSDTPVGIAYDYSRAAGGAIYNYKGIVDYLKGDYSNNKAIANGVDAFAVGGALFNSSGKIGYIDGDFTQNSVQSDYEAYGGAIYNNGTVATIAGNFVQNNAQAGYLAEGGAIYLREKSDVEKISGTFTSNHAVSYEYAWGGAIYNRAGVEVEASLDTTETNKILDIHADFKGNYVMGGQEASGGAIANDGEIGSIKGNFEGNYSTIMPLPCSVTTYDHNPYRTGGGAIANWGKIESIESDFTNNYAIESERALGGAIYNDYYIGSLKGNFSGNFAEGYEVYGGALYNNGYIGSISGDFVNNHVKGADWASGGAVTNNATPAILSFNDTVGYYERTIVDADNNPVFTTYYYSSDIMSDDSYKESLKDGANITPVLNSSFSSTLEGMYSSYGVDNIEDLKAALQANGYSLTSPEDIYEEYNQLNNQSEVATLARTTEALTFRNSSFINNYAEVTEDYGAVLGGAIDSIGNIRMIVDDGDKTLISGNYVKTPNGVNDSAITMSERSVLVFDARNNSTLQVDDKIEFEQPVVDAVMPLTLAENDKSYFLLVGDNTGKIVLNNDVIGAGAIALDSTNVYLGRDNVLDQSNAIGLGNGFLSMANGTVGTMNLPSVSFQGETNLAVDVDLATETMDRIIGGSYTVEEDAQLHVSHLNLLSDATKDDVKILFADEEFAPIVDYTGGNPVSYSPIYKYDVGYKVDEADKLGYFFFNRSAGAGNPSDNFNPSVLATPAAQQSGAQATVTESVRFAFQHADTFTQIPLNIRMSMMDNKYAILEGNTTYQRPFHMQNKGIWVKPYTSFESMDLKNGPSVDAITYGTLIGFDTDFQKFKNGWYGVTSAYVGYNGSLIDYADVNTTMNGGMLGLTETWYRGKFFTALTATAGASAGSTSAMYGHENFAMLLGGIGSKTGYNFEFKDGRYIIQPILFMNYTFVNTFDYTSASGVAIDSDPLHSLQLNPSVRFIANYKNGWQPYASVGMVWNVLNSSKVRANDVLLPKMSIKPYVEYGIGLQRTWAERFTAYGQAMVRNGGRNGVMLSGGMRWTLGEGEAVDIDEL